jgi:flagellar motor switch protein FliN
MTESKASDQSGQGQGRAPDVGAEVAERTDVVTRIAEFAQLGSAPGGAAVSSLDRLLDVNVVVTAELGRVSLSIGDVLKLSAGAVLQLDRMVSEPVDLMVQGKRLARGEVVVVDDRFAIRIKELSEPRKKL